MKSITKKLLSGLLLCAILCSALAFPIAADTTCSHALENGAYKFCQEVAKKVTVAEGKLLETTDGMYFDGWKITSAANDYALTDINIIYLYEHSK